MSVEIKTFLITDSVKSNNDIPDKMIIRNGRYGVVCCGAVRTQRRNYALYNKISVDEKSTMI